ncbi:hypothetical protein M0R45_026138 [Rubus argutus]|uniref:Uncharacterized protein n=1 Tax=Rubus argutus TaxID=59490 RepID=A0AAW1WYF7_RUBAR
MRPGTAQVARRCGKMTAELPAGRLEPQGVHGSMGELVWLVSTGSEKAQAWAMWAGLAAVLEEMKRARARVDLGWAIYEIDGKGELELAARERRQRAAAVIFLLCSVMERAWLHGQ